MGTRSSAASDRFAFLDTLRELPSLPQVLVRISRVASDPKSSATDLAEVILRDQAVTLRVLRMANSARYALYSQQVTTVSRAVMLLGFQTVRAIALGLGGFQLLSTLQRAGGVLEGFWREAMTSAVICQGLAEISGMPVAEEAFVAGLLHDVGKLILAEHDPEKAVVVYGSGAVGPELLAAERAAFGMDHAEVGGELGRRWDLPDVLRKAMAQHHRHYAAPPVDRADLLAFLVGASRSLAQPLCGGCEDPRDLAAKMARVLQKPVGSLVGKLMELPDRINSYASFFEIDVEDLKDYTLWVEGENQRLAGAFSQQEEERRRLERRKAEMAAIREVHALLVQGAGIEQVARRVLRASREAAGARRSVVALLAANASEVRPTWAAGDVTPPFLEAFRFPLASQGLFAEVLTNGQAINVFDTKLPYFERLLNAREAAALDAPALAVLPVQREGRPAGVLYVDRAEGDEPFADEEMDTLAGFADLIALALRGT